MMTALCWGEGQFRKVTSKQSSQRREGSALKWFSSFKSVSINANHTFAGDSKSFCIVITLGFWSTKLKAFSVLTVWWLKLCSWSTRIWEWDVHVDIVCKGLYKPRASRICLYSAREEQRVSQNFTSMLLDFLWLLKEKDLALNSFGVTRLCKITSTGVVVKHFYYYYLIEPTKSFNLHFN